MNADELTRRAEQELADGNPSARKTAWLAHAELFKQRDAQGLERLLDLASRLGGSDNLENTIRHDLDWLSQRDQPDAVMDITAVLLGAAAGGVIAIALTYWLVHGPEADVLTFLAAGLFFLFFGIPLGAVLGLLLGRRFQATADKPSQTLSTRE